MPVNGRHADAPDTGDTAAGDAPAALATQHRIGERTRWLRGQLADPFSRNAYALVLNTGLTGLLGVAYWWLAPHYYSDADVGRGSALISVMTLLSGAVAINLTGTLNRFIPRSGRHTARLVGGVYLLSSVVVLALGGGFLLTLGRWGATFAPLREPVMALCFASAVVIAGIFTMEDAVLTGLRSSVWVPVGNTCFGVIKIVFLVLLASSLPHQGLYLSWVIAMALLVPPINALIFTRLLPRHGRVAGEHAVAPTRAQLGGFFAGDYLGALFVFAAGYLVPVVVAADLPPDHFAHFYLAWSVVGILNLVPTNLANSLTVEGVYEAARLATNCRAALRRALAIVLAAIAAVALLARWGFAALGPGYLTALPTLFALAVATLPRAVVEIWIGVLRARGLTRQVARVQIAVGVVVVGFVLAWLRAHTHALGRGLELTTGVGLAVLLSYAAVAVAVAPGLRRFLSEPTAPPDHRRGPRARAARRRRPRARFGPPASVAVCALSAAAVIGYLLPLKNVDLARINGLGLISVLAGPSLTALALLALAFALTLSFPRPRALILGAQLAATVCCLHGVAALIEPLPRFPTTWVHMGFVEYIGRTGTVLPDLDARFNWPGFFALIAFVTGKHDWASLVGLMSWTPLISNLLYLLPLGMLLRNLRASWRAKWFAAWLFSVLNWVGQDYFSPQGFSYLLYLVFLAVLITWFRGFGPEPPFARWKRRHARPKARALAAGELPARAAGLGVRVSLLLLLVAVFAAATFTHQLTPFVMLSAITGLVLVRRCGATGLPWLLGVIVTGYVSYVGAVYWAGHFKMLRASLGDLIGNLLTGTALRASGGSPEHHAVLSVRSAITVAVFLLAAVGLWRRRRDGTDDRVALVLLLAPLPAIVQSYGGEMVLRVYLFALPGACVLAAYAFFPATRPPRRPWRGHLAAAGCALVLLTGFLFARYGNEAFEMTRPGELAAAQWIYHHNPTSVLFLTDKNDPWATPFIPLGYQDVDRVQWKSVRAPTNPRDVRAVIAKMQNLGPQSYLLTTRGQRDYLQAVGDYPRRWADQFRAQMSKTPRVRVVDQNTDAVVYALQTAATSAAPTTQRGYPTGVRVENTPWTGVGLFFLLPLLVALLTREVLRLRLAPDRQWRLIPLTLVAAPLLVVFATVLVERLTFLTKITPPPTPPESVCDLAGAVTSGGGQIMDFTQLQRPSGWCLLKSPLATIWSKNSPTDDTLG